MDSEVPELAAMSAGDPIVVDDGVGTGVGSGTGAASFSDPTNDPHCNKDSLSVFASVMAIAPGADLIVPTDSNRDTFSTFGLVVALVVVDLPSLSL